MQQTQVRDIINNLKISPERWQESSDKKKTIQSKLYPKQSDRISLFREICNRYAKNGKFEIKSSSAKSIINNIYLYCSLQNGEYDLTKGLYIHGSVGGGKSTLMKIVRDFSKSLFPTNTLNNVRVKRPDEYHLLDSSSSYEGGFRIVNTTMTSNAYKLEKEGENSLEKYFAECEICFDEFGREPMPVVNYGTRLNVMQYILEMRYDNWNKTKSFLDKINTRTHITTNILTGTGQSVDLAQLSALYEPHIADRIREMCNIIHLDEKSFRG